MSILYSDLLVKQINEHVKIQKHPATRKRTVQSSTREARQRGFRAGKPGGRVGGVSDAMTIISQM